MVNIKTAKKKWVRVKVNTTCSFLIRLLLPPPPHSFIPFLCSKKSASFFVPGQITRLWTHMLRHTDIWHHPSTDTAEAGSRSRASHTHTHTRTRSLIAQLLSRHKLRVRQLILASLSPNKLKRALAWPRSHRVTLHEQYVVLALQRGLSGLSNAPVSLLFSTHEKIRQEQAFPKPKLWPLLGLSAEICF